MYTKWAEIKELPTLIVCSVGLCVWCISFAFFEISKTFFGAFTETYNAKTTYSYISEFSAFF